MNIKLVTYNIRYSLGRDGRYDLPPITDAIRTADSIALQEVERGLPTVPIGWRWRWRR